MSDSIVRRRQINILAPYNMKQIVDQLVLEICAAAKDTKLGAYGKLQGWTEPPTVPPLEGNMTVAVKLAVKPFSELNHVRWLQSETTLCEDPDNDDFVNTEFEDRPACLECSMRLMAKDRS